MMHMTFSITPFSSFVMFLMEIQVPSSLPFPAFKKGRGHALNEGDWITGMNGYGLTGFPGHREHVIVIVSRPKINKNASAGYTQNCICMECKVEFREIDGEFLQVKMRRPHLEKLVSRLTEDISCKEKIIKSARSKSYEG